MNTGSILTGAVLALLGASSAGLAPQDLVLKPKDHQDLAEAVQGYYKARLTDKGRTEAMQAVLKTVASVEKRNKIEGQLLSLVGDLEQALYLAEEFKSNPRKGISDENFESRGAKYRFTMCAPKNYQETKGPYALLLLFPAERGKARELLENAWISSEVRDQMLIAVCEMPEDAKLWTEIGGAAAPGGLGVALSVLREVRTTYAVDVDRIFVGGHGPGVAAATRLAAIFPHVFAGIVGRAGDMDPTPAVNFGNVASFWSGAGANCTAFEEEAKKAGYENCTVKPDATEAEVWEWMKAQRRSPHPPKVRFSPASLTGNRAYWLQVDGFELAPPPLVEVVADRATNTVRVTATGVTTLQLFFNDVLVDLSKPIEVVINGVSTKDLLPRNVEVMLDLAFKSGDCGRVYTAYKDYDVPGP